jgi:hypothetical protein
MYRDPDARNKSLMLHPSSSSQTRILQPVSSGSLSISQSLIHAKPLAASPLYSSFSGGPVILTWQTGQPLHCINTLAPPSPKDKLA